MNQELKEKIMGVFGANQLEQRKLEFKDPKKKLQLQILLQLFQEYAIEDYERGMFDMMSRVEVDKDEVKLNPSGWVLKRAAEIKKDYWVKYHKELESRKG